MNYSFSQADGVKRLEGPMATAEPRHVESGDFYGRRKELAGLQTACDSALAGRGNICLLVGEPGIGKTRITEEVASLADAMKFLTARGLCIQGRGTPPLWPWIQILRSCVDSLGFRHVKRSLGGRYAFLSDLLKDGAGETEGYARELCTRDGAQFALSAGIARLLRNVSKAHPALIILEDLQWADRDSLTVLQSVSREVAHERICVIGTYRDERPLPLGLGETIGALLREPSFTRYYLDGLTVDETSRFLETLVGSRLDSEICAKVFALTDGNPLYVKQVGVALESGAISSEESTRLFGDSDEGVGFGRGFDGMITGRFASLSDTAQRVVTMSSLLSKGIDVRQVAQIEELTVDTTIAALDEACSCHLLDYVGQGDSAYRFSHLLIRELVAARVAPAERFRLHAKIASALAEQNVRFRRAHAVEIFHHALSAGALFGPEEVARHAHLAGMQSMRLYDCERALSFFRQGIDRLRESSDFSLLGELLEGAARAATHILDIGAEGAFHYFEKAVESYVQADDLHGLKSLLHCDEMLQTVLCSFVGQERFFGALLAFLPEESGLWRWTEVLLAGSLANRNLKSEEGVEMLNRSATWARTHGDTFLESLACCCLEWVYYRLGRGMESYEHARRGRELSTHESALFCESGARLSETRWLFEFERYGAYRRSLSDYRRMAERTGYPRALCFVRMLEMGQCLRRGQWEKARAACDEMGSIAARLNELAGLVVFTRGVIALATGDQVEIDKTLSLAQKLTGSMPHSVHLCRLLVEYGLAYDGFPLVDELEEVSTSLLDTPHSPNVHCRAHMGLGVRSMLRGDQEGLVRELHQIVLGPDVDAGNNLRYAGVLSVAGGEVSEALGYLNRALEEYKRDRPRTAQTHLHLGEAYFARSAMRSRTKGSDHLRLALDQARSLCMPPLEKKALRLMEKLSVQAVAGPSPEATPAGLTKREVEVLIRIAAGSQDKEIAYDLGISLSTVHNHVRNILRKTKSGNRTEAGRFASENGFL
jgi:DNA-binding CsgD family transcriptional regulator/tetratricopeptide (TPR) repeat protein